MSFSGMVKEELSRHIGSGRHCRIAELDVYKRQAYRTAIIQEVRTII